MANVLACPKCAKKYRLGESVPAAFACTACGAPIDLSRFEGVVAPPRNRSLKSRIYAGLCVVIALGAIGLRVAVLVNQSRPSAEETKEIAEFERDAEANRTWERLRVAVQAATAALTDEVDTASVELSGTFDGKSDDTLSIDGRLVRTGPGPFKVSRELLGESNGIPFEAKSAGGTAYRQTHVVTRLRGVGIRGRITGGDGGGYVLSFIPKGASSVETTVAATRADGSFFRMTGGHGPYVLFASRAGSDDYGLFEGASPGYEAVEVPLRKGETISGHVAGLTTPIDAKESSVAARSEHGFAVKARLDEAARFTLRGLPPGETWTLDVIAFEGSVLRRATFAGARSGATELTLTAEPRR